MTTAIAFQANLLERVGELVPEQADQNRWEWLLTEVAGEKRPALMLLVRNYMADRAKRVGSGTSAIVQSALKQALIHPETRAIEGRDQMFKWISSFVVNKCRNAINRFESRRVIGVHSDDVLPQSVRGQDFEDEVFSALRLCLDELTPEESLIAALKVNGWTHEQIGAELRPPCDAGNVTDKWRTIRRKLRDCAARRGFGETEE